jgi:hypothetical protein
MQSLRLAFTEALNRHGYAFQHAIVGLAGRLFDARESRWLFEGTEFPVAVQNTVTHIDIVLKVADTDVYLVGECKRVDPALGRWCFARSPFTRRDAVRDTVILEQLVGHPTAKLLSSPLVVPLSREPYHITSELRTGERGDGTGTGRDTLERSVTQVLRGVSGLVEHFLSFDWAALHGRTFRFIPVVFTTAELWTTEHDISQANVSSGRLDASELAIEPAGWLWFNYNMSPQLRHSARATDRSADLASTLVAEGTRSVAIVSPSGIERFLRTDLAGAVT